MLPESLLAYTQNCFCKSWRQQFLFFYIYFKYLLNFLNQTAPWSSNGKTGSMKNQHVKINDCWTWQPDLENVWHFHWEQHQSYCQDCTEFSSRVRGERGNCLQNIRCKEKLKEQEKRSLSGCVYSSSSMKSFSKIYLGKVCL